MIYTKGQIVEYSWGYDQTNIDYFVITKRTPKMVTLQPIGSERTYNAHHMTGTCMPNLGMVLDKPAIRRKVAVRDGEEVGIAINSYGWADLWDGEPGHYSAYA